MPYLDHAASSPLRAVAAEAMREAALLTGNPSSVHSSGRRVRARLEESRERLAEAVGADPAEVIFTGGGTEADNLIVLGAAAAGLARGRTAVAAATTEHVAVRDAVASLGDRARWLGVDETGMVRAEDRDGLDDSVALVSVAWVNNETGTVQDPAPLVEAARRVGALAHSDGVQALGHLRVDFAASGLDALSLSAHKVGGPVGIGALVLRREVRVVSPSFGGGQERRLRSGTVPVALAAGFAAATDEAVVTLSAERQRLGELSAELVTALRQLPGVRVHAADEVSPAIVHATFDGCRADDLLLLLDRAGIDCSTGAACTAGVHQPSQVLLAMGRPEADAVSSLRFSFGPDTGAADIAALVAALGDVVPRARHASG
ncbi:MAG: cysteine desulfurase family protein [Propioniciclava sp.]